MKLSHVGHHKHSRKQGNHGIRLCTKWPIWWSGSALQTRPSKPTRDGDVDARDAICAQSSRGLLLFGSLESWFWVAILFFVFMAPYVPQTLRIIVVIILSVLANNYLLYIVPPAIPNPEYTVVAKMIPPSYVRVCSWILHWTLFISRLCCRCLYSVQ
jgi:hypothetical protein